MYKVLIADDEWVNREGLAQSIPWEEFDCHVAGLACNGLDCVDMIDAIQPHILITDIKMPGKTGLEVTEYSLKKLPDLKVILLSGYNDFDYARKAVELGAFNYILKPTVYENVVECIQKAVASIRIQEELARFKEIFTNQIQFYKKAFLQQLIMKPAVDKARMKESLQVYGLQEACSYTLLILKIDHFETILRQQNSEEKRLIMQLAFEHRMNLFLEEARYDSLIPLKEDLYCIILPVDSSTVSEEFNQGGIYLFCERLQESVREHFAPMSVSIGISNKKSMFSELHLAYTEAAEALQHILYLGSESIIFYDGVKPIKSDPAESYLLYVDTFKELVKLLKAGNEEMCIQQLAHLFQLFDYHKEHPETVRSMCIELGAQIGSVLSAMGTETVLLTGDSIYSEIMNCETTDEYYNTLSQAFGKISREVFRRTRTAHKKIVGQVLELMEAHFKEDISLQWISEQIHMNSSYISRLIKNECGETFTQLLNRFRLEQAKKLLKDPKIKVYEVSEKTGFTDSQYFANKFKKYTGMTPTEFRDHYIDLFE